MTDDPDLRAAVRELLALYDRDTARYEAHAERRRRGLATAADAPDIPPLDVQAAIARLAFALDAPPAPDPQATDATVRWIRSLADEVAQEQESRQHPGGQQTGPRRTALWPLSALHYLDRWCRDALATCVPAPPAPDPVAAERERCARVCEAIRAQANRDADDPGDAQTCYVRRCHAEGAAVCAAAIRALPAVEATEAPAPEPRVGYWASDGDGWLCHCGTAVSAPWHDETTPACPRCGTVRPPRPEVKR